MEIGARKVNDLEKKHTVHKTQNWKKNTEGREWTRHREINRTNWTKQLTLVVPALIVIHTLRTIPGGLLRIVGACPTNKIQ